MYGRVFGERAHLAHETPQRNRRLAQQSPAPALVIYLMEIRLRGGQQAVPRDGMHSGLALGRVLPGEHDVGHGESRADDQHGLAGAEDRWALPGIGNVAARRHLAAAAES